MNKKTLTAWITSTNNGSKHQARLNKSNEEKTIVSFEANRWWTNYPLPHGFHMEDLSQEVRGFYCILEAQAYVDRALLRQGYTLLD